MFGDLGHSGKKECHISLLGRFVAAGVVALIVVLLVSNRQSQPASDLHISEKNAVERVQKDSGKTTIETVDECDDMCLQMLRRNYFAAPKQKSLEKCIDDCGEDRNHLGKRKGCGKICNKQCDEIGRDPDKCGKFCGLVCPQKISMETQVLPIVKRKERAALCFKRFRFAIVHDHSVWDLPYAPKVDMYFEKADGTKGTHLMRSQNKLTREIRGDKYAQQKLVDLWNRLGQLGKHGIWRVQVLPSQFMITTKSNDVILGRYKTCHISQIFLSGADGQINPEVFEQITVHPQYYGQGPIIDLGGDCDD